MHCHIGLEDGVAVITDLRSTNGTFVDDRRIYGQVRLGHGSAIRLGPYVIRYVPKAADTNAANVPGR